MKADILACWSNTWVDRLIRTVVGEDITHIAIKVSDTMIMESTWLGTQLSPIAIRGGNYYVLRCPELTEKQREKIVEFVLESVNKKYDFKLFIGIGLNRLFGLRTNWDNPTKYICVELILEAYKSVGIDLLELIPDQEIVPSDFLKSDKLYFVNDVLQDNVNL